MFSHVKTAATAALMFLSVTPASAAIVDVFMTASLTGMFRQGGFVEGEVDYSKYDFVDRVIPEETLRLGRDANVGDEVTVHWQVDTEPRDTDTYTATTTINGESWTVFGTNGFEAFVGRYDDLFGAQFNHDIEWFGSDRLFQQNRIEVAEMIPDSFQGDDHQGILTEFSLSGDNLGSGSLEMYTNQILVVDGTPDDPSSGYYDEIISSLRLDYQITSIKTSLRDTTVAPVPLPAGALLLASGLFGFGMLRRRKASA